MLPKPTCPHGYTEEDILDILGPRYIEFSHWMSGQTMMLCDGRTWNGTEYEDNECTSDPHGGVVYPWDLERFIDGRPIID